MVCNRVRRSRYRAFVVITTEPVIVSVVIGIPYRSVPVGVQAFNRHRSWHREIRLVQAPASGLFDLDATRCDRGATECDRSTGGRSGAYWIVPQKLRKA